MSVALDAARASRSIAVTLSILAVARAQDSRAISLPLDAGALDRDRGTLEVTPRVGELAALADVSRATFAGVALPDGTRADLELERIDLARLELGWRVDGEPAPHLLDALDLSVWTGRVRGVQRSEVALSFSRAGCGGWVRRADELFHLIPKPGDAGDWTRSTATWVSEGALAALGATPAAACSGSLVTGLGRASHELPESVALGGPLALTSSLYRCPVAVETDFELFQQFGNLSAETSYVTALLAWVSYRYEQQVGTVLTYPYVMLYTSNDPWTATDSVSALYELQSAWQFNVPAGAALGTFVSGAPLGGGVAWLPGLCNEPYNFSACGDLAGLTAIPIVPYDPWNWDFVVIAHELGHNFNAIHTHDYCPTPVDECAPAGYFGSCQTSQTCTSQGSLMSYCHLCPGGFQNESTLFHSASAFDMRTWVEGSCLALACADPTSYCTAKTNSLGCVPQIGYDGHPTLSGLDDFRVKASNVLNNKNGLMYWGFASLNSPPFQGGYKCVGVPSIRTPVQVSGGSLTGNSCTGSYQFLMSHAYMQSHGIAPGSAFYCQYWMRDPSDAFKSGMTGGLAVTACQ